MQGKTFRVLIIGCGELGSRHLQAVSALGEVGEIEVIDPAPDRLQKGRTRIDQVEDRNPKIRYRWLTTLDEASPEGDLCVVATRADVRCRLVREVAERRSFRRFLIEKVVAQSMDDYDTLLEYVRTAGVSVWVNCKTRAHEAHRSVKRQLTRGVPITLSVIGGNHGLANYGLHAADLFAFYSGAQEIELGDSRIDPVLHPSKRGPDVMDLSGTLSGYSDQGSRFFLSLAGDHAAPPCISIVCGEYEAVIDDMSKLFMESTANDGWRWRVRDYDADLRVSYMTRAFASDILSAGRSELPTLEECRPAHEFILNALQPHFSRLVGKQLARSPVT